MIGKTVLGIAAAALIASSASAADWQMFMPYGTSPSRHIWFADKSSVQTESGGVRRAWFQMINETPDTKGIKSMKALIDLDCRGKRTRFIAIEMFGANNLLGSKETPGEWSFTAPDSPFEGLGHAVCAGDYTDAMSVGSSEGVSPDVMAKAAFQTLDDHGNVKDQKR